MDNKSNLNRIQKKFENKQKCNTYTGRAIEEADILMEMLETDSWGI